MSEGSTGSSGSEKGKKLLKASERKPSSRFQSVINNDDSENEDDQAQGRAQIQCSAVPRA